MAHGETDRAADGARPIASIIVRAKNEEALLGETLGSAFTELSRARDHRRRFGFHRSHAQIARSFPSVRLIEIRPEEFTFGRALNIGCRHSRGEFLVFLSAHALPGTERWLASLLGHFADERVVGVWGAQKNGIDARMPKVVRQIWRCTLATSTSGSTTAMARCVKRFGKSIR